jgi:hypothetical protein
MLFSNTLRQRPSKSIQIRVMQLSYHLIRHEANFEIVTEFSFHPGIIYHMMELFTDVLAAETEGSAL